MKKLSILALTLAACDPSNFKTAIADLELPDGLKSQACDLYRQRGEELAESIWVKDWPTFAPIFTTPPDPVADLAYCREVVTSRGVKIVTKPEGEHGGTALVFLVALPPDFGERSPELQAAVFCHEAAHIVWQQRRGKLAARDYLTVSGRLVTEGTAYAIYDALLERYNYNPAKHAKMRARRAKRFPERYKVDKTVDAACVSDYFDAIRDTLRERAGV